MWPNLKGLALLLIAVVALIQPCPASVAPKRVLLHFQDDGGAPAYIELEQSVRRSLRESMGPTLELYREQLDLGRFPENRSRG